MFPAIFVFCNQQSFKVNFSHIMKWPRLNLESPPHMSCVCIQVSAVLSLDHGTHGFISPPPTPGHFSDHSSPGNTLFGLLGKPTCRQVCWEPSWVPEERFHPPPIIPWSKPKIITNHFACRYLESIVIKESACLSTCTLMADITHQRIQLGDSKLTTSFMMIVGTLGPKFKGMGILWPRWDIPHAICRGS